MKRSTMTLAAVALAGLPLAGCYDDYGPAYAPPPPPPPPEAYYAPPPPDYVPDRDYREEQGYDQALTRNDRVYRGNDGRYYCRRSDGTTGTVVGAVAGGALGAVLSGGGLLGTLIGAGGGALLGRSVDKGEIHCR